MITLDKLSSADFADKNKDVTIYSVFTGVLASEANFHTLLMKYNVMVDAYNQLAIKVFDLEQALKGSK